MSKGKDSDPWKPEVVQGTLDLMVLQTLDALGPSSHTPNGAAARECAGCSVVRTRLLAQRAQVLRFAGKGAG